MDKKNRYISDFLFSTPNFLSGAGTVMNLAGDYYKFNDSKSELEADSRAIRNDFNMIGQDIADAIENVKLNDKNLIFAK
jgi:hypothetical protein